MRKARLVLISLIVLGISQAGLTKGPVEPSLFNGPQDCPDLNLDDRGGPLENVPVFDQGMGDACYAHAGATVATVLLNREAKEGSSWKKTDVVSPTDTVFQEIAYTQSTNLKASYTDVCKNGDNSQAANCSEWADGGLCDSLEGLKKSGACRLSATQRLTRSGDKFDRYFFDRLRPSLHMLWKAKLNTWSTLKELNQLHQLISDTACMPPDQLKTGLQDFDRDLEEIVITTANSQVYRDMKALNALLGTVCKPREPLPAGPQCKKHQNDLKSDARKKEMIAEAFSHGMQSLPVGLGYCSDILYHSGTVGLLADKDGSVYQKTSCGGHLSLLIGQRWNPKSKSGKARCEYQIRNSWGKDCDPYSPDWECVKGKGDIWVDAGQLLKNTDELDLME